MFKVNCATLPSHDERRRALVHHKRASRGRTDERRGVVWRGGTNGMSRLTRRQVVVSPAPAPPQPPATTRDPSHPGHSPPPTTATVKAHVCVYTRRIIICLYVYACVQVYAFVCVCVCGITVKTCLDRFRPPGGEQPPRTVIASVHGRPTGCFVCLSGGVAFKTYGWRTDVVIDPQPAGTWSGIVFGKLKNLGIPLIKVRKNVDWRRRCHRSFYLRQNCIFTLLHDKLRHTA